jgi:hypothetical protein
MSLVVIYYITYLYLGFNIYSTNASNNMDSKDDDISSTCSTFSQISFRGDQEVDAEQAIDESIKSIQAGLNNIQVGLRCMLMADSREDSYEDMLPMFCEIEGLVKEGVVLMKEVRMVGKQLMPPKPRAIAPKKTATTK